MLHKGEKDKRNFHFLFLKYQESILGLHLNSVLKQHSRFRRIFQPHSRNFSAEESNINRKIYQGEFLEIHKAAMKGHNNLCKLFQMLHYSNTIFSSFFLRLAKEYFISMLKYLLTQTVTDRWKSVNYLLYY